jgi:hypothetical protein
VCSGGMERRNEPTRMERCDASRDINVSNQLSPYNTPLFFAEPTLFNAGESTYLQATISCIFSSPKIKD